MTPGPRSRPPTTQLGRGGLPAKSERARWTPSLAGSPALVAALLWAVAAIPVQAVTERPNILLIIVDDLGAADLACLGSRDLRTPHLDSLFAESLQLQQYYANSPVCSPTRAAVLTGCYPDRVGVPGVIRTDERNSWGYYQPRQQTLPQHLQDLGYDTAAVGKWHLGLEPENHPKQHGFDYFKGFLGDMMDDYFNHRRHGINYMRENDREITPQGHATDLFSQWAIDFIEPKGQRRFRKPWFLYLAFNAPHTPIQPPPQWLRQVQRRESDIDPGRAALVALIEHLDDGIGKVLQALRDSDQYHNTMIVFTSDNGGQLNVGANNGDLRDGKGSMYEGGLRIPGCLKMAGQSTGATTAAVASTVDLMPTLIEIAGGEPPEGLDGNSLRPLLTNPDRLWPQREIYFVRREGGPAYAGLTSQALRKGNFKLVHHLPTGPFELYDLAQDPQEQTNVADQLRPTTLEMIQRLQFHVQRGGVVSWQKPSEPNASLTRSSASP